MIYVNAHEIVTSTPSHTFSFNAPQLYRQVLLSAY